MALLPGLGIGGAVLGGLLLCRRDQKTHDLTRDNTGTVTTGQIAMGYGAECHAAPDSAVGIARPAHHSRRPDRSPLHLSF
jgi:hypothetical protein